MKILIVGSKGFIGSNCVSYFSKSHEVWGCDVYTDYNENNYILVGGLHSSFVDIFIAHKFDHVINCSGAASVPDSFRFPGRDYELNVSNVAQILEAIRMHNPGCRFINLSSAAVYGSPVSLPVKETSSLLPLSPYGFHKLMAEKICEEYHHFFGLSTCSLRIFSAFGPGLRKQLLWELYHKAKMSDTITLFGTGDETRDYIFIDDIMRALEVVLLNARFDAAVYNLASGSAKSTKWMANCLLQSVGWRGALNFSGSKRTGDPDHWTADITLLNTLGFHPMITTEEGIKYYAEWLLSLA